jgi:hypothetical protein
MSRILVNELGARTGTDIAIKSGSTLGGADSQLKITGGSSGQVLVTNGLGSLTWSTLSSLPAQSGQLGKFLTTDGNAASWATIDAFPTQTSNSGKFLTTDGTNVSWADALPSQSTHAGKYLTTNGTTASWGTVAGAEIQELNNFFKNWNIIDTTITTSVPSTENAAIIGPLGINSTGTWNIDGLVTIM